MSEEKEEREPATIHEVIGIVTSKKRRDILVSVRSLPKAEPTVWCNRIKKLGANPDGSDADITKLGSIEPDEVDGLVKLLPKAKAVVETLRAKK